MKMQPLAFDAFQEAKVLLGRWLQCAWLPPALPGALLGPPALPAGRVDAGPALAGAPTATAAVSSELVSWHSLGLESMPPDQLVVLVKNGFPHTVCCLLIPLRAGASPGVLSLPGGTGEGARAGWLRQLYEVLEKNLENPAFTVEQLADCLAISPKSLLRKVQALLSVSPKEFMQRYRLCRAARLLQDGYRVGEVADLVGFNSATHFGQCFKKMHGISPGQYAAQGGAKNHSPNAENNQPKSKVFCPKSEHEEGADCRNIALSILC